LSVHCPHCDKKITPNKSPRPGRYDLHCPGCEEPFQLIVPRELGKPWQVKAVLDKTQVLASAVLASPPNNAQRTQIADALPGGHQNKSLDVTQDTGRHLIDTPSPEVHHRPPVGKPRTPDKANSAHSIPEQKRAGDRSQTRIAANLPGYRVERAIGTGGMGSVFLARQLSLDRPVALKVMSHRWANDPIFVARFTREAFAAALLNHPNVVQIYDIGEADGTRFFSMEYVAGRSLSDLVKQEGKLEPETAVGYILQAARGLKHAHDRGMIHRDVKPDNLLLDDQGIVKVADLGLVKTPDMQRSADRLDSSGPRSGLHTIPAEMTGVRMALGTPAYMAPEQCRDAASVDHRADIYSLGCTLYVLVTGRQPFDGQTAVELMTKHAYEPLVPPEMIVNRLPKELSAVIQKMMAKDPSDRYQGMSEVIRILEQWLGIHHAGKFCPRDEQIDLLEQHVLAFNNVPAGQLRSHIVTGFISICLLGAVLLSFFGQLNWAFGVAGMILQASVAYFVLNGMGRRTYLYVRIRQFIKGQSYWDWGLTLAGFGLFILLLWMLGLFWVWGGFGLIAVGLAFGLRFGLDRGVEEEREEPLKLTERLLRRMRFSGVDEEEIRGFVAKYSGRHWEEFFEALFGYEAKIQARQLLLRGGSAGNREKFAAWREPLIALIDHIETARQESRDRVLLQKVEQARLLAAGESLNAAQDQAKKAAAAMVQQANVIRAVRSDPQVAKGRTIPNLQHISRQTSPSAFDFQPDEPKGGPIRLIAEILFGPPVRAFLAATLLAGCVLWVLQNRIGFGVDWRSQAKQTVAAVETRNFESLQTKAVEVETSAYKPVEIEGIPEVLTNWIDSASVGWAGLLLVISLIYRGNRMGFLLIVGSGIIVLGHKFGIRNVEPLRDYHVSWLLGTVIALIGLRMGRKP
jgi:eukaryotic-like serine/threonine-protein kinase